MEFQRLQNTITGASEIYVFGDGAWRRIATVPRTKLNALNELGPEIEAACKESSDWSAVATKCQSLIDNAPSVPPGDISAQVFDQLKLLRKGSAIGDLLETAASGDMAAMHNFPKTVAREEMIWAFGSHIVRFSSVIGEGLGSGILVMLPQRRWGILTCSHVWTHLAAKHARVQILCACTQGTLILNQRIVEIATDTLFALDMADPTFMEKAEVDALLFKRDSAIIMGDLRSVLPPGARAIDLRDVFKLVPKAERYALVGYPLDSNGELAARFLQFETSSRNHSIFLRHPTDQRAGSLNGASGGLLVAFQRGRYRPVGLMVEEHGAVEEISVDSVARSQVPSVFHVLLLVDLRTMIQNAGELPFRRGDGATISLKVRN